MPKALIAGCWYFAGAFGAGFALGIARVLLLEPHLGPLAATLIEVPVMLAILWPFSALCVRRFAVPATAAARLAMGGAAVVLLLAAETLLGLALGQSLPAQVAAYASPARLLGLAAQIAFALFPLIQARLRPASQG